jgi:hypothetical protein
MKDADNHNAKTAAGASHVGSKIRWKRRLHRTTVYRKTLYLDSNCFPGVVPMSRQFGTCCVHHRKIDGAFRSSCEAPRILQTPGDLGSCLPRSFCCVISREPGLSHGELDLPLEIRASAIAIFCANRELVGGAGAPFLFGLQITSGQRPMLRLGDAACGALRMANWCRSRQQVAGVGLETPAE